MGWPRLRCARTFELGARTSRLASGLSYGARAARALPRTPPLRTHVVLSAPDLHDLDASSLAYWTSAGSLVYAQAGPQTSDGRSRQWGRHFALRSQGSGARPSCGTQPAAKQGADSAAETVQHPVAPATRGGERIPRGCCASILSLDGRRCGPALSASTATDAGQPAEIIIVVVIVVVIVEWTCGQHAICLRPAGRCLPECQGCTIECSRGGALGGTIAISACLVYTRGT